MMTGKREEGVAATGEPRERLIVKDGEDLHVLGRFFRAMLINLLKDPDKARKLDKLDLVVGIEPPAHPHCALSVAFSGGRALLQRGVRPDADIRLVCGAADLMKLARVPAGAAAVKFLATREGRALVARVRAGEVRIKGAARHPLRMMRFAEFLAPSST